MSTGTAATDAVTARRTRRPRRVDPGSPAAFLTSAGGVQPGYRVPPFTDGLVPRAALVERLLDSGNVPLALIVAPPGYGKSTLLAEWAAADERPFIWFTLRPDDRDAIAVAAAILQGLVEMGCRDRPDRRFVLVLDDAHTASPAALRSVVTGLLDQLGEGSQIALASRTEPALPIGRLRAHRCLVEVRTSDLAMSPAEAAALLRSAGLELDFSGVQTLLRRTEGWPVGLYLAALSLRGASDIAARLKTLGGDDRLIAEYFRDELLHGLSPERRGFVIRTAVLEDLAGPLCDAVLDQTGSAATLAELARGNLMLVALDHSDVRFRWHRLFREMLRAELRRREPGLEGRLHGRASAWLQRHGDVEGAIGHAVAAGDAARAGDLLLTHVARYLAQGRNEIVAEWLNHFTPSQITDSAPLALVAAHSCLMSGNLDQARRWGRVATAVTGRVPAGTSPSLEAGIAVIEAAATATGALHMAQAATRGYDLDSEPGPWRAMSCLLRGIAEYLIGNRVSAQGWLEEGAQRSGAELPGTASLCLAQLAVMAIDDDDWESAGELADQAAEIVQAPRLAACPIAALVFATSAATRARRGRVDESKRDLLQAVDLLAALGDFIPWYGAQTRIVLARAAVGLADSVRARSWLAQASRLARRAPDAVTFQPGLEQVWAHIDTLAESALSGPSSLTIAELRVLRFLPSHRTFREIAERLDVSVNTVKTQAHAIYGKLNAASRSEAVARAASAGLLGS